MITAGIVFIILISIYLYAQSRNRRERSKGMIRAVVRLLTDFVFVWVMLSLLVLYIVSIGGTSSTVFALGNVVIEVLLIIYLLKNTVKQA